MDSCNNKAAQLKNDCEFRHQGGTTEYTACRCQAIRSGESCYRTAGCTGVADLMRETSPECFSPTYGGGGGGCGLMFDGGGSNPCECDPDSPDCVSPVLIDVAGNGFRLTDVAGGIRFDLRAQGHPLQVAWTTKDSDDAWLVLDRNGNGTVDDGSELFGNFTTQPGGPNKNGFIALAQFDKPENGGNSDGAVDRSDEIFNSLRLWQDKNHNGVSEVSELISLQTAGVGSIGLDYKEAARMDRYGNLFRYRSKLDDRRFAYDVFLIHE